VHSVNDRLFVKKRRTEKMSSTVFSFLFIFSWQMRVQSSAFKALANKDTLLRTQMFPRLPERATSVADPNFVSGTKNVPDFVQKHFVSATNFSQFAQPKKHHEQQCVRNNVSSFAKAFKHSSRSSLFLARN